MVQIVGSIVITIILGLLTFVLYRKRKGERLDAVQYTARTEENLLQTLKNNVAEITRESSMIMAGDLEYEAITRNNRRILKAAGDAPAGVKSARLIMKGLTRSVMEREIPTYEIANEYHDFEKPNLLDPMVKWELLIIKLTPKYKDRIIEYLESKYHLTQLRVVDNGYSSKPIREFDYKLLDYIFKEEVINAPDRQEEELILSYNDVIEYFTQHQYSIYKGARVIDSLLTMKVDGINFGTSGSIRYEIDGDMDMPYRATNSVWVQINANWVLFSFLDFYTMSAMKQTITQLVSWGNTAPMTEKVPYKVTDGWDGSRRTAFRPPAAECWCMFIRNFNVGLYTYQQLLDKPWAENWEMVAELIHYLVKAEQTLPFTGQQNTGKTTFMKSVIADVDCVNIRVLEMAFELALREIYCNKNIITVKPTEYVSSEMLQDLLKKSDGWLSMVGEVADNKVAARMIQFRLISSPFTMFSHHGVDDDGLVKGLENSLVGSGEFHDHKVARDLVLDAIQHNIHFAFTKRNERVIEYISQIIKINTTLEYPEMDTLIKEAKLALKGQDAGALAEVFLAYSNLTREYYTRSTDRVAFTSRKIIEYNETTKRYEPREWYTPEMTQEILRKLPVDEKHNFMKFYRRYWR